MARAWGSDARSGRAGALAVLGALLLVVPVAGPAGASEPEWNVARIGAPMGASDIVVAVVDTHVDASHPTFGGRVLRAIDVIGSDGGDPAGCTREQDGRRLARCGHGTHVAGTVGGGSTGPGVGVAHDVRILPVRVLDQEGSGYASDVAEGIREAADAGAHVINLSLGGDVVIRNVLGSGLESAIEYAWSKGSIPVLAAGNDDLVGALLGSGYGNISAVVVTATGSDDRVASYANAVGSARWGIAAPGGDGQGDRGHDIRSALPGDRLGALAGTSMAAPHVSGALAVLRAHGLSPAEAVDRLLGTARSVGPRGTYGAGLVDLAAATSGLARSGAAPPTTLPAATAPPAPAPPTTAAPAAAAPAEEPVATAPGTSAPTTAAPTTEAPDPTDAPTTRPPATTEAPAELAAPAPPGGRGSHPVPAMAAVAGIAACTTAWVLTGRSALARLAARGGG